MRRLGTFRNGSTPIWARLINRQASTDGFPIVRTTPLPTGAQFLNVIESVFSGIEAFRAARYYGLDHEYKMAATDLSPCLTSISIDGHSMSVLDYGGLQVGMPTSVRDLEFAIDEVAGTRTWLRAGEDHPKTWAAETK